jgi:hypothetical protein
MSESLETRLRKTARQLWREYPNLSFDQMADQHDIKELVRHNTALSREQIKNMLVPELTPQDELPILKSQRLWTLGDAAALWLDLNPFLFFQAFHLRNPSFFNMPIHPSLREKWIDLRDQAANAARLGELKSIFEKDQHWVKPRDFYAWAMIHKDDSISARAAEFFTELKTLWDEEDIKLNPPPKPKPIGKLEQKKIELKRILGLLKLVDVKLDFENMPGRRIDFQKLCIQLNPVMFAVDAETFNDYLPGLCKFNSGARETDYYANIAPKLGGN